MNVITKSRTSLHSRSRRVCLSVVSVVALGAVVVGPLVGARLAGSSPLTNAQGAAQAGAESSTAMPTIPAPPPPPTSHPSLPVNYTTPSVLLASATGGGVASGSSPAVTAATATTGGASARAVASLLATSSATTALAPAPPAQAVTWGSGPKSTLILYDTTGQYGFLGELYAEATGNLASHFGTVTAEPVVDYESGQVAGFNATIYIGSTYNEPIPVTFLNDALVATSPVLWMGDNIWQLSGTGAADTAFQTAYGWDPATSYYDTTDTIGSVTYNGQTFTRNSLNGPVLAPHITSTVTPSPVSQLAQANCMSAALVSQACSSVAQSPGGATATSFPWAIHSANLTYLGEIPISYITETDRYIAFSGLLYNLLDPNASPSHLALVRLEDLSPADTAAVLVQIAQYLHSVNVPFSMNIISDYVDPSGYYNTGVPVNIPIDGTTARATGFVSALKQMMALGGTLNIEGYTHQYTAAGQTVTANPYSGVSGDDFEFYRAQCSTTATAPYAFVSPCTNTDHVIEEGPVTGDSASWAAGRLNAAIAQFKGAGLPVPALFINPHYAASAVDYAQEASTFPSPTYGAYDRRLYFGGQLTPGAAVNYNSVMGQFFPYTVHDLYGTTVIPENLGDYEPTAMNFNPVRNTAQIVAEAKDNLAVTQGTASFFFDPDYFTNSPTGVLQNIVTGIKGLGYTFVSPVSLLQASSPSSAPTLYVTTNSLPGGTTGTPYSGSLAAAGGTGTDTWSITSGALPAGLNLNAATGAITGTPTTPGTSTVTVTATDTNAPTPDVASMSLTIAVGGNPPATPTTTSTTTPTTSSPAAPVSSANPQVSANSGYTMVGSDGGVFSFGNARFEGSLPGLGVHVQNIRGIVPTADAKGYWMVGSDGGVFSFGNAGFVGSLPGLGVRVSNIAAFVPAPDGRGYWMVGSDGGVFGFGSAAYLGSLPALGVHVNDIVGMVPTASGKGYWMVGADGGVFAFGDAPYVGSLPALRVHVGDVAGIVGTSNSNGYWMVGADGGVFSFGNAGFVGSLPGLGVHVSNVVGIAGTTDANGYTMIGNDGGVFSFGDAVFAGSLPALGVHVSNVVGIARG